MAVADKKTRRKKGSRGDVKIPLSWRALALTAMLPIGLVIFYFGLRRAGVALPISEKDRDPLFFSFLFAVTVPAFIYAIIKGVMIKVLLKKSSVEIGKEIAKDVAEAVAMTAVDVLTGSTSEGESRSGTSSSDGAKGGGGDFGGGGASGSY